MRSIRLLGVRDIAVDQVPVRGLFPMVLDRFGGDRSVGIRFEASRCFEFDRFAEPVHREHQ